MHILSSVGSSLWDTFHNTNLIKHKHFEWCRLKCQSYMKLMHTGSTIKNICSIFQRSAHNDVSIQCIGRGKGQQWRIRPGRLQVGQMKEQHMSSSVCCNPMQSRGRRGGQGGAGGYYTISWGSPAGWRRDPLRLISSQNGILSEWPFESLSCHCIVTFVSWRV